MSLKKIYQIESFAQSEDQLYTQIFSHYIFSDVVSDFSFVEKKKKNINFYENYINSFLNLSYVALGVLGITYIFQTVGFIPRRAVANPVVPSNTVVTLQTSIKNSKRTGYTLSGKNEIFKNSKNVVVAGLQSKIINRGFPSLQGRSVLPYSIKDSRSASYSYTLRTSTQRGMETLFGVDFIQVSNANQVIRLTRMQIERVPIVIKNYELIRNPKFSIQKNDFVEKHMGILANLIDTDPRLNKINKYLQIEGWIDVEGTPVLAFDAGGSFGRHYQNKKLSNTIIKILDYYLKENIDLFTEENQFALKYNKTESEHPNQKYDLIGAGLNRDDAHTYQISKKAHKRKTSEIDLLLPTTVKTIPNAFFFNGEATINTLEDLYDRKKLTHSIESLDSYKHAVRECIKGDIADYQEQGRSSDTLDYPGQIKASIIGEKDCTDFTFLLANKHPHEFHEKPCIEILKNCVKKSTIRAAYINQGLNQFPEDSPAHRTQNIRATHYVERFVGLVNCGIDYFPALATDQDFLNDIKIVVEALNGKGNYDSIIHGEDFVQFKKELSDPQSRINLIPRNAKNFIFKNKK